MKILIRYGDNDYYSLMELVCKTMLTHEEQIKQCLNYYSTSFALEMYVTDLITALHLLTENLSNHPKNLRIYVNDQVPLEMKYFTGGPDWDNNESVVIDFETQEITFY